MPVDEIRVDLRSVRSASIRVPRNPRRSAFREIRVDPRSVKSASIRVP
jgi:hypothetical protein